MELSQQCVNLELAKKLKELGVKQDSIFDWVLNNYETEFYLWLMSPYTRNKVYFKDQYSAFSVGELGELLPKQIWRQGKARTLKCEPANKLGNWLISYTFDLWDEDNSEANARAKMLIYLIENKIIEVPK